MSIYQYIENVINPIFTGLREDVRSWLVPTLSIAYLLFIIGSLIYLLIKVLRGITKAIEKPQIIEIDGNNNTSKKRKNKKRFY